MAKHTVSKMWRSIARKGKEYPDRRIMHPARDWLIGIFTAAFLFLAGSGGAGYLFWRTEKKTTEARQVTVEMVAYDRKLIGRVLTDYRARNARYELLRIEAVSVLNVIPHTTNKSNEKSLPDDNAQPVAKEPPLKVE